MKWTAKKKIKNQKSKKTSPKKKTTKHKNNSAFIPFIDTMQICLGNKMNDSSQQ
jgi:hypothetical protein